MLTDTSPPLIEHDTSRSGRWLRARRNRIALSVALVEAIVVVIFHDVSRFTVIGISIVAFASTGLPGARRVRTRSASPRGSSPPRSCSP